MDQEAIARRTERRFARYAEQTRGEESIVMKESAAWNVDEIIMVKGIAKHEGEKQLLASIQESDRKSIKFFGEIDSASLSKQKFLELLSTPVKYVRVVWYVGHGGCNTPLWGLSLDAAMPEGFIVLDNGRGAPDFVTGSEIFRAIHVGNSLSKQNRHEGRLPKVPRTILILNCCYAAVIAQSQESSLRNVLDHPAGSSMRNILSTMLACDPNGEFGNNVRKAVDDLWEAVTIRAKDDEARQTYAKRRRAQFKLTRNALWTLGLDQIGNNFTNFVVPLSVGSLYDKEGLSAMLGDTWGKGEPDYDGLIQELFRK